MLTRSSRRPGPGCPSFLPGELGDLSRMRALRHVLIPVREEDRDAWIDVAVAHPAISFDFRRFEEPTGEVCSVEEVHRGVDVLRVQRGTKKPAFEVAGDLAALRKRYRRSNEDLEDELRPLAKKERRAIDWRSENDMLVARAKDDESCRWIIDRAIAGQRSRRSPLTNRRSGGD